MRSLAGFCVAGALLLSGCVSTTPEPTYAPTPSESVAPAPSPTTPVTSTPAPSPMPDPVLIGVDLGDPSTWDITFRGIGPVSLGASIEQRSRYLDFFTEVWHAHDECALRGYDKIWYSRFSRAGYPSLAVWRDFDHSDLVVEVWIMDARDGAPTPRTVAGIGLGSTLGELRAAYPDLIEVVPEFLYQLVDDVGTTINFGIDDLDGPPSDADKLEWIVVSASPYPILDICGG